MKTHILKPNSASRLWRATRRKRPAKSDNTNGTPIVRVPTFAAINSGKAKRPPAYKAAPLDVTAFQKTAHEKNAIAAHTFHADRSKFGTFGQSPANRNPFTVAQRKRNAAMAVKS